MRVAVFFDGKNFHSGMRSTAGDDVRLDFPKLADWLVRRAGGDSFWGAHYYTGVERGEQATSESQVGLSKFLSVLEYQPGFFVHRFARKVDRRKCSACGAETSFSHEKEVDTTMVADILRLAAVDGFDVLVLVSGDADLAPAVDNVRALGKKVYVAAWGWESLAARMRQAAFDHIDLRRGLEEFRWVGPTPVIEVDRTDTPTVSPDLPAATSAEGSESPTAEQLPELARTEQSVAYVGAVNVAVPISTDAFTVVDADSAADAAFMAELSRAERKFQPNGYVGLSLFLNRWRSDILDPAPHIRQRILDRLLQRGLVEAYETDDGSMALRRRRGESSGPSNGR